MEQDTCPSLERLILQKDRREALQPVIDRILTMMAERRKKGTNLLQGAVAINGSAINVGKTWVSGAIMQLLHAEHVAVGWATTTSHGENALHLLRQEADIRKEENGLLLFDAMGHFSSNRPQDIRTFRESEDRCLRSLTHDVCSTMFWIGLYSPKHPFPYPHVLADILIRNEGAQEK